MASRGEELVLLDAHVFVSAVKDTRRVSLGFERRTKHSLRAVRSFIRRSDPTCRRDRTEAPAAITTGVKPAGPCPWDMNPKGEGLGPPKGECCFCGALMGKGPMRRHLDSCGKRREALRTRGVPGQREGRLFHLVIEGRHLPEYWMHVEVPEDATLDDLDRFLRRTWLECCGHLSAFTIGGRRYALQPMRDFRDLPMRVPAGRVLRPGLRFTYEYDFGTTTELALRVATERKGSLGDEPVMFLARNERSLIQCEACGGLATQVCGVCIWEAEAWYCDGCVGRHSCGDDYLRPVVNSPRTGMCGYTGPMEEDWRP